MLEVIGSDAEATKAFADALVAEYLFHRKQAEHDMNVQVLQAAPPVRQRRERLQFNLPRLFD